MATINPFQPPINYAVDVQSPFEAALGGFKLGAGVAEIQAAKQAREKAQATQTELANLFKNPLATAADYDRVAAFLPKDQAAIVTQGFERKTKEQQANDLRMGAEVYSAIKSGNLPVAKQMLTDQATAFRNSGREDQAKAIEDSIKIIDLNPTGAQATIGLYMARLPGGKEFLDNADKALSIIRTEALAKPTLDKAVADASAAVADAKKKVAEAEDTPSRLLAEADYRAAQTALQRAQTAASEGGEARSLTKFGPELRETIAKADKGVADAITAQAAATNAPEKAAADAALTRAQADKAKVEAQFATQIAKADIDKRAADLGLTKAQKDQVLAATKKLGQETAKIVLEIAALENGDVDPAKKFEQEEKLRKEYQGRTKIYGELGSTYSNIESSAKAKTGPGDIALITGFMKMLDPGSVVRETEFATARDTAGLFDRLANQAQKLTSGQLFTLDSKQRQEYVNLAKQYLDSAQKKAVDDKKALGIVVKNYKLNPENVFGQEAPPLPTSATVGGQTYTRPPGFTDAQWRDYLKSQGVMQ